MRRNILVLTAMILALALMVTAGVINFLQRRKAQQARLEQLKLTLVPDDASPEAAATPPLDDDIPSAEENSTPLNGKIAPAFTLQDLNGNQVSLSAYKGRPLVVDFWATWCGPCKVEIPWFEKLHDQYSSQGLEIIGISADELDKDDPPKLFTEKRDIAAFASKMHMNYPILIDGGSLENQYGGLDALPTTFFIDRNGKIVASTVGLAPRDEIEANIKRAIAGGAHS